MTMLDFYSVVSNIFVYLAMAEYALVLLAAERKGKKAKLSTDEKVSMYFIRRCKHRSIP